MGGDDHRCAWRDQAESLASQLAAAHQTISAQAETIRQQGESLAKLGEQLTSVHATVERLQRHVFEQRTEKMPAVADAIRDPARAEAARVAAQQKRRENAEKKRQLVTRTIEHKVREDQKTCPKCGGHEFSRLGGGERTEVYELVPARVERQVHVQEKLRCRCGETIMSTITLPSARSELLRSDGRTSSSLGTTKPERIWPASTRSSRRARRTR